MTVEINNLKNRPYGLGLPYGRDENTTASWLLAVITKKTKEYNVNTQTPKRFPLLLVALYLAYLDKHQGLEDELNSGNWSKSKQAVLDTVQQRIDDLRDRIPFNLRADALYTFWYNCSNKVSAVEQ